MIGEAVQHLVRRVSGGEPGNDLNLEYDLQVHWWTVLLFIANVLWLVPFWLMVSYTFGSVIPEWAMIEDEQPPAYARIPLDPENADATDATGVPKPVQDYPGVGGPTAVSASLRSAVRLLRAQGGGFRAWFRGFPAFFTYKMILSTVTMIIMRGLGSWLMILSALFANLALVQLHTAWVHVVITPRSDQCFWNRRPDFRKAFAALAYPVTLLWVAEVAVPVAMVELSGYQKHPAHGILTLPLILLLRIPAETILARVQASLLPESQETIVAFDRSFGGLVEPAVVTGVGYPTIAQVWKSIPRSLWKRIIFVRVKVFCVFVLASVFTAMVLLPQALLVGKVSKPE